MPSIYLIALLNCRDSPKWSTGLFFLNLVIASILILRSYGIVRAVAPASVGDWASATERVDAGCLLGTATGPFRPTRLRFGPPAR